MPPGVVNGAIGHSFINWLNVDVPLVIVSLLNVCDFSGGVGADRGDNHRDESLTVVEVGWLRLSWWAWLGKSWWEPHAARL